MTYRKENERPPEAAGRPFISIFQPKTLPSLRYQVEALAPAACHPSLAMFKDDGVKKIVRTAPVSHNGLSEQTNSSDKIVRTISPAKGHKQRKTVTTTGTGKSGAAADEKRPAKVKRAKIETSPRKPGKKRVSATGRKRTEAKKAVAAAAAVNTKRGGTVKKGSEANVSKKTSTVAANGPKAAASRERIIKGGEFQCMIKNCDLKFVGYTERRRHMDTHFDLPTVSKVEGETVLHGLDWGYVCPAKNCIEIYARKDALRRHMKANRKCRPSLPKIPGIKKQPWETETGSQLLREPPPTDTRMHKRVLDLWKKYGCPSPRNE